MELERVGLFLLYLVFGVYALSCSSLVAPLRVHFGKLHALFEDFIYCPVCTGFWIGGWLGVAGFGPIEGGLAYRTLHGGIAAVVFIASLRAIFPRFLQTPHELEGEVIRALREKRNERRGANRV